MSLFCISNTDNDPVSNDESFQHTSNFGAYIVWVSLEKNFKEPRCFESLSSDPLLYNRRP